MADNNFNNTVEALFKGMDSFISTKTVVGDAITFGDTIIIKPYVKEYSGVRMTVGYEIADKKNGKIVLTGETKHCFTDKSLKPINLKKYNKEFNDKFESLLKK